MTLDIVDTADSASAPEVVGRSAAFRWPRPGAANPLQSIGGFFALSLDILVAIFKPPFAWRELSLIHI